MTQPAKPDDSSWTFPAVKRWGLSVLPAGWTFVPDFGIRQTPVDAQQVAASVALGEDKLTSAATSPDALAEYISIQAGMIQQQIPSARVAGPQFSSFPGAEQAYLFMVRHQLEEAVEMLHVQTYVRTGIWVGIITLTTTESSIRQVRPDYEAFLKGLRILPESVPEVG